MTQPSPDRDPLPLHPEAGFAEAIVTDYLADLWPVEAYVIEEDHGAGLVFVIMPDRDDLVVFECTRQGINHATVAVLTIVDDLRQCHVGCSSDFLERLRSTSIPQSDWWQHALHCAQQISSVHGRLASGTIGDIVRVRDGSRTDDYILGRYNALLPTSSSQPVPTLPELANSVHNGATIELIPVSAVH